jgi:hypothetical protein
MKVTIEFSDFIDENEWEFVGYGQIKVGEYGLLLLDDKDWSIADCKEYEAGNDTLFCFRKKQKFVWPEQLKEGAKLRFNGDKDWLVQNYSGICFNTIPVSLYNSFHKDAHQINTSMLDKNKVYIKGEG